MHGCPLTAKNIHNGEVNGHLYIPKRGEWVGANDEYFIVKDSLMNQELNIGFTYTNYSKKSTVVIIGLTTSAAEFQNTFDHEKGHVAIDEIELIPLRDMREIKGSYDELTLRENYEGDFFVSVAKQTAERKNGGYEIEELSEQKLVFFISVCLDDIAKALASY